MCEGLTVVPFREGKITVKISFSIAKKIEIENYVSYSWQSGLFPLARCEFKLAAANLKDVDCFIEKMGCVSV